MSDKTSIRIIKRSERDKRAKREAKRQAKAASVSDAAEATPPDLTTTMTGWIEEFQVRKDREAGRVFAKFFEDPSGQTGQA